VTAFCSDSYQFALDLTSTGPVLTAARTNEVVTLTDVGSEPTFKRAALAEEFGIRDIHFLPVDGGVLEFGKPKTAKDEAIKEINHFIHSQARRGVEGQACRGWARRGEKSCGPRRARTCMKRAEAHSATRSYVVCAFIVEWCLHGCFHPHGTRGLPMHFHTVSSGPSRKEGTILRWSLTMSSLSVRQS